MKFLYLILTSLAFVACESQPKIIVIEPIQTGSNISIRGAAAVSDSVVWLTGTNSTILRTTNGGTSWEKLLVSDTLNLDIRNVWAFDASTAVVASVASPAYIFKTTDGGKTWKNVYYNNHKNIFINSMAFKDAKNGVVVGDQIDGAFFVLKTLDGGNSWIEVEGAKGKSGEGGFAASNTCVSYLPSGNMFLISGVSASECYIANDKNFNWKKHTTNIPIKNPFGTDGAYTIYMKNDKEGLIGGGNYMDVKSNAKVVGVTSNGGKTWRDAEVLPHGFISCIKPFSSGDAVLAIGSDGVSFSEDFGKTWSIISSTEGYHTASSSPDSDVIYVAGSEGRVSKMYLKQSKK